MRKKTPAALLFIHRPRLLYRGNRNLYSYRPYIRLPLHLFDWTGIG